jgi:hypothetical protein
MESLDDLIWRQALCGNSIHFVPDGDYLDIAIKHGRYWLARRSVPLTEIRLSKDDLLASTVWELGNEALTRIPQR